MSWQNDPVAPAGSAPWVNDPVAAPSPRAVLGVAAKVNPDQAAEAERLAKRYPAPSDVLLRNLTDAKLQAAVDDADAKLTTDVPALRQRMTDVPFARVAHDDVSVLAGIESFIRQTGRSIKSGVYGADRGAAGVFQAGAELVAPVLDFLEADLNKTPNDWRVAIGGNPLRRLAEGFANIGAADLQTQKALRPQGEQGVVASGFFSGIESLTQNTLMLPAAFLPGGQSVALTGMVAMTGGQSYQDAREKGLGMSQALPFAASQAAIEYATERIPLGRLIGDVKAGTPIFQTLMRQIAAEVPGEQVATILQDLNEWAVLNPDKPFTSYLEERPSAAAQTLVATIVGAGGSVTIAKGLEAVATRAAERDAQASKSDADLKNFERTLATAAQSKLRERAPETFAQFVQEAAQNTEGAPTAVYVDARALTDALNQAGITDEQLAQIMPSVPAQIASAFEAGGVVEIPIGEALAAAPGTPIEQVLLQNARMEPDGLSRAEVDAAAKEAEQLVKAEADRVMQQADQRAAAEQETATIRQTIADQINATKRFRPEVGDAYATMVGAFYATTAQRLGVTPSELYARYPLRVTGEMQTGALEQGDEWMHGSLGPLEGELRAGTGTLGEGFYLTNTEKQARIYPKMHAIRNKVQNPDLRVTRMLVKPGLNIYEMSDLPAGGVSVEKLKAAGYDGVRYRDELNVFDPANVSVQTLEQQTRATFSPSQMLIALGPNADYSSFLHETGHFWLEVLSDIASQPNAPQQVVDDMNRVLEWFGIKGTEQAGGADSGAPLAQGGAQYPMAPEGQWYGEGTYKANGGRLVSVTPDEYIAAVRPLTLDEESRENIDLLKEHIQAGKTLDPLLIRADGKEDGRHRAYAAKELGIQRVPVIAYGDQFKDAPGYTDTLAQGTDPVALGAPIQPQRTPLETWNAMTLDQKRPYHERWAESVEQYFFEGRAPSVELRGVFDRFRTWLMAVYKSLKQFLASRTATPGGQAGTGQLAQSGMWDRRTALRELHREKGVEFKDASIDRGGAHSPAGPEDGSPAYDVALNGTYPEDFYGPNGLRYYGTGYDAMDAEVYAHLKRLAGRPNHPVTIYRAVEKNGPSKIQPGDWVTPVRAYAKDHGEGALNGDYKIIKLDVKARDIWTAGDSMLEWGYHPQDVLPEARPPKGDTLAQSAPAAQAVRAEQTMAKSPVTGKPEFALFDAEGNRLGVYRSAATADEAVANFNQRRTVQSQPEPQVRVDAPQPVKSKEPRSNWKIVRGQKFTNLDEDDGYLYHVTSSRAASDIIRSGLVPNSPRTFGNAYAGHSASRVFLTERSGVSYWQEKVEHNLQSLYDRPPAVTVVRIPKGKVTAQLQPDEAGSADARRPAYYAEGEVLFQTDGKFKPAAGPLNLTDEIRAVMDRLLATDEQITEMERVREYGLLFKSPEEAGMTPEQWAAYTSADEKAHAEALTELSKRSLRDMGVVMRKRMRALREVQRDMAEKRKAVEEEAATVVAKEPVYQAMRWLKKGEMTTPEGEEVKVTDGFKLDAAAVDAIFPESMPGRPDMAKLRGMTLKKGGLDPAIVADMFGFRDGAHLITSIVEAFPQADQVQGLTDQMMLERYGDLSQPRGMERAADEAVHNENRARVLAAEMATISAANNARAPGQNGRTVNAMVQAAKLFAERLVESKKVKDLKPQQHTAAETRAARAAEKALAKGDTEGVIVAKRDQLLNFHAAKATNEARTEALKVLAWFKKVATLKDDAIGKTRDLDVVKAMQAVLAAYDVGTKGKAASEYMELVKQNDPTMYAALEPGMQAALATAKPVDQLTLAELRALNDELQAMWFLAKRSRQMEVDGNLLDIEDAAEEVKARMLEIGIPDSMPGDTSAITPAEQRALKLKGFLAAARRVESWAQAKDGTGRGPFRRLVWEPVREAANRYRVAKAKQLKAFRDLLKPIEPTLTKRQIDAPELGYTFGKDTDGVGVAEILHAILHTGNDSNKRKLLLGRKWATENADGTLDTSRWDGFVQRMVAEGVLQPAHFDFAQGVWDLLEGMKPLAQKTHREVFGRYFNEVTANEFVDPFGVKRRGGYVPAQADARIVSDQATKRLLEDENASMQFAFPTTAKGFTKGRVEYNRPLLLDLRSLTQHIDKVLLFSHMESPVRDVRKLLTQKGVAYGLNRLDPVAFDSVLTPWLNRAAKQQVETPVAGDAGMMRFFSALRRRAGMAAMFGNVANAVQQLAGFSMAAVRVKPSRLASATAQYMAGPRAMVANVAEKSDYMRTRLDNEVANMTDAINDILLDPSVYERTKAFLTKHSYFLQSAVDNVMGPIIWTGAYNQALEQGMEDKDAVRYADSAIRETQGSTAPEDVSRIETGNAFVRLFTQFAGYFNMQANLLGTEFNVIARDLGLRKGLGRGLYVLVFGYLVNAWVAEAIMQAFKGGPDDDDKDGDYLDDWLKQVFGWSLVRNTTAMVPVVGPAANALINTTNSKPYDDRISTSPAISMIESAVKVPSDVYKIVEGKDVKPSTAIRDTATLISMLTGIPANAFAKPVGYLADVDAGKVTPTSPADAVRGTVTGAASPESKR